MFQRSVTIYSREDWPLVVAADTEVVLETAEGRKVLKRRIPGGLRARFRDFSFLLINWAHSAGVWVKAEYNYGMGPSAIDVEW